MNVTEGHIVETMTTVIVIVIDNWQLSLSLTKPLTSEIVMNVTEGHIDDCDCFTLQVILDIALWRHCRTGPPCLMGGGRVGVNPAGHPDPESFRQHWKAATIHCFWTSSGDAWNGIQSREWHRTLLFAMLGWDAGCPGHRPQVPGRSWPTAPPARWAPWGARRTPARREQTRPRLRQRWTRSPRCIRARRRTIGARLWPPARGRTLARPLQLSIPDTTQPTRRRQNCRRSRIPSPKKWLNVFPLMIHISRSFKSRKLWSKGLRTKHLLTERKRQ